MGIPVYRIRGMYRTNTSSAFKVRVLISNMAIKRSLARNKKAKPSNNLLSILPPEIIETEILPRVAVKSLLRYRSVCKSWNLLISTNPDFIKSQLHLTNKDSLILCQRLNDKSKYDSFISRDSMFIGCINGLVCVFRWHNDASKVLEIAIWNPATNQCLVLPPLLKNGVKMINVLLGFGFDSVTNDFKVIYGCVAEKKPLVVDVYSCKAACWKKIAPSSILYSGDIYNLREPIIFNGSPFWLNQKKQDEKISLVVISFDVRNEVFRLLPSVSCTDYNDLKTCDLMNFRDSFAIMVYDVLGMYLVEPIDVYIFNQRSSAWNKKISIGPFICKEPNIKLKTIFIGTFKVPETTIKLHKVIPCFRNGDILFLDGHNCGLYGVNPKTQTIKILKEVSYEEQMYKCFNYSESLIFIEGMKPISDKREEGGKFNICDSLYMICISI